MCGENNHRPPRLLPGIGEKYWSDEPDPVINRFRLLVVRLFVRPTYTYSLSLFIEIRLIFRKYISRLFRYPIFLTVVAVLGLGENRIPTRRPAIAEIAASYDAMCHTH